MQYKYDIFISYRRDIETKRWIDTHFIPLLVNRITPELNRSPIIYIDDKVEAGVIWPKQLGEEISLSRIIIALWQKDYLCSKWCTCEISHMMEREILTNIRTKGNLGLILPVIIHDGETLPKELDVIQKIEIQKLFNSRMNIFSEKAEKLSEEIAAAASGIANMIKKVPPLKTKWRIKAINDFYNRYYIPVEPEQISLPKFSS